MLKGIPKIISPELLKILDEMGHGDEIVIADGNFPSESMGQRVVRADGHGAPELLSAIVQLFPLDSYSQENFILMELTEQDKGKLNPVIWEEYKKIGSQDENFRLGSEERFAFYERAKKAYAVVATGESALYANVILKKGVIS